MHYVLLANLHNGYKIYPSMVKTILVQLSPDLKLEQSWFQGKQCSLAHMNDQHVKSIFVAVPQI